MIGDIKWRIPNDAQSFACAENRRTHRITRTKTTKRRGRGNREKMTEKCVKANSPFGNNEQHDWPLRRRRMWSGNWWWCPRGTLCRQICRWRRADERTAAAWVFQAAARMSASRRGWAVVRGRWSRRAERRRRRAWRWPCRWPVAGWSSPRRPWTASSGVWWSAGRLTLADVPSLAF